jgi:hypothetical protein
MKLSGEKKQDYGGSSYDTERSMIKLHYAQQKGLNAVFFTA